METLLLTQRTKYCKIAQDFIKSKLENVVIEEGEYGNPFPIERDWDYIICFISPWIVPKTALDRSKTSINFHPGPPKYPGTGCYNFAIYNGEEEYGVTCHHMLAQVDSGQIIKVVRFPMYKTDSVFKLKERTMHHLLKLFYDICNNYIIPRKDLPVSKEKWLRKPYRRKDLQELCKIKINMDAEEVKRRFIATYFPDAKDPPRLEE